MAVFLTSLSIAFKVDRLIIIRPHEVLALVSHMGMAADTRIHAITRIV